MKMSFLNFLPAVLLLSATAGYSQALHAKYNLHRLDLGVAGGGQFTTSITNQTVQESPGPHQGTPLPHQATDNSPMAVATLHFQPKSWAGFEANYSFARFAERFYVPTAAGQVNYVAKTTVHEGTGAYLVHVRRSHRLSPYLGVGGGYLDFQPPANFHHQIRGTGLVDLGFDMQTSSSLGFRIGARDLVYRAPNFQSAGLSSSRWVSSEEPYVGVFVKF